MQDQFEGENIYELSKLFRQYMLNPESITGQYKEGIEKSEVIEVLKLISNFTLIEQYYIRKDNKTKEDKDIIEYIEDEEITKLIKGFISNIQITQLDIKPTKKIRIKNNTEDVAQTIASSNKLIIPGKVKISEISKISKKLDLVEIFGTKLDKQKSEIRDKLSSEIRAELGLLDKLKQEIEIIDNDLKSEELSKLIDLLGKLKQEIDNALESKELSELIDLLNKIHSGFSQLFILIPTIDNYLIKKLNSVDIKGEKLNKKAQDKLKEIIDKVVKSNKINQEEVNKIRKVINKNGIENNDEINEFLSIIDSINAMKEKLDPEYTLKLSDDDGISIELKENEKVQTYLQLEEYIYIMDKIKDTLMHAKGDKTNYSVIKTEKGSLVIRIEDNHNDQKIHLDIPVVGLREFCHNSFKYKSEGKKIEIIQESKIQHENEFGSNFKTPKVSKYSKEFSKEYELKLKNYYATKIMNYFRNYINYYNKSKNINESNIIMKYKIEEKENDIKINIEISMNGKTEIHEISYKALEVEYNKFINDENERVNLKNIINENQEFNITNCLTYTYLAALVIDGRKNLSIPRILFDKENSHQALFYVGYDKNYLDSVSTIINLTEKIYTGELQYEEIINAIDSYCAVIEKGIRNSRAHNEIIRCILNGCMSLMNFQKNSNDLELKDNLKFEMLASIDGLNHLLDNIIFTKQYSIYSDFSKELNDKLNELFRGLLEEISFFNERYVINPSIEDLIFSLQVNKIDLDSLWSVLEKAKSALLEINKDNSNEISKKINQKFNDIFIELYNYIITHRLEEQFTNEIKESHNNINGEESPEIKNKIISGISLNSNQTNYYSNIFFYQLKNIIQSFSYLDQIDVMISDAKQREEIQKKYEELAEKAHKILPYLGKYRFILPPTNEPSQETNLDNLEQPEETNDLSR